MRHSPASTPSLAATVLAAVVLAVSCGRVETFAGGPEPPQLDPAEHRREIEAWRAQRIEKLRSDEGWLSLVGLSWLEEGANRVGSDPASRVALPADKAPAVVGVIELDGSTTTFVADPGASVTLDGQPVNRVEMISDADGGPTKLELGDLVFYLIRRDRSFGVRVKDRRSPARLAFEGIESFPIDPAFRFTARFEPYDPPKQIPIANVVGQVTDTASWGAVVFEHDGAEHRLDVLAEPDATTLFVIFADGTTGRETYGAGRYLYADPPSADGTVILDFNKAYNPPCVFTEFATCPLPPPQNRLAIRIEAGEKTWGGH